ncbi:MAG: Crp/Fnr family transcriptional regulator [Pseudomonadota bacterium]
MTREHAETSIGTGGQRTIAVCATCAIRHSGLCGALTSDEITDLTAIARRKHLTSGQKLVRGAEDGRSQIVGLLFPSDFIGGYPGLQEDPTETQSIVAVTDLELCLFPRGRFEGLVHRYPSLESKLLHQTRNELQLARDWIVLLGRKTAEERVASFFLHVSHKLKNLGCAGADAFDLPLGRADIADYIGLTVETVSRQITKLRKAGIVELQGAKRVTFIDHDRLRKRAGFQP